MEKHTDNTPQRPKGERVIDDMFTTLDLNSSLKQIKEEEAWQTQSRNSIVLHKSDQMRIVMIGLHKDAELKEHTAPGAISVQVLEGQIDFSVNNEATPLAKGQMITLHKRIPHSVYAQEESVFLLTISM